MIIKIARRAVTASVAGIAVLALGAGTASAHFCYFTEANARAELGRANSKGFATFGDLAFQITHLCPAGVAVLADAAGVSTTTTINMHGTMAGGTLKSGKDVKPISHLDIGAIEGAMGDAIAACTP